jgi:hypothetical protein
MSNWFVEYRSANVPNIGVSRKQFWDKTDLLRIGPNHSVHLWLALLEQQGPKTVLDVYWVETGIYCRRRSNHIFQVDVFIRRMNSIPAFTANLTIESFNKRSICWRHESSGKSHRWIFVCLILPPLMKSIYVHSHIVEWKLPAAEVVGIDNWSWGWIFG